MACRERDHPCYNRIVKALENESSEIYRDCDCLPECNHIKYTVLNSASKLSPSHLRTYNNNNGTYSLEADVSILFSDDEYVAYRRFASYDTVSLLSDIGGYLGLFLGISFLSVIETVYFFTLRFINNILLNI